MREALEGLDGVDIRRIFSLGGAVMKSVPKFLFGPFHEICIGGGDSRSPRQGSGTLVGRTLGLASIGWSGVGSGDQNTWC